MSIVLGALGVITVGLVASLVLLFQRLRGVQAQYVGIANAEEEIERLKAEGADAIDRERRQAAATVEQQKSEAVREVERLAQEAESLRQEGNALASTTKNRREVLDADYANAKTTYDRLYAQVTALEENLEDISFGLYKPHFNFDTPDEYKERMDAVREKQKVMLRNGEAAKFAVAWSVGGSRREGERMQKQYMKLLLRAFNGECDAAIARVSWNNVTKMEERVRKSFDIVNDLGGVMQVSITQPYLDLKIDELRLEFEMEEKKHQIADEQRRIREQMRDEEKSRREAEQMQQETQIEETRFERALDKARVDLAKSQGEEHNRLNDRIVELQAQLEEARTKGRRAKALAELTKAGYVYVISNVGSFGEGVFKIGMTRRLDPMDRVKDLSDASVPFPFDVHAMVYSDDAPTLEWEIQRHFADRSLNLVNMRKEFFRVSIEELEILAKEKGLKIYFTRLAEAREYRETLTMRATKTPTEPSKLVIGFPDRLPIQAAAMEGLGSTPTAATGESARPLT